MEVIECNTEVAMETVGEVRKMAESRFASNLRSGVPIFFAAGRYA